MKTIDVFFPMQRLLPTYRLAMSFLRHPRSLEVSAWEHTKTWNNVILYVVRIATVQILNLGLLGCVGEIALQLHIWAMRLWNPRRFDTIKKFTPWLQTAGFGVFAGRAFNKGEMVIRTWMTLFLPQTIPNDLIFRHYCFGFNNTHSAIPLNYGSLLNHHESANTRFANMNIHVRAGLQGADCNVLKHIHMHSFMHAEHMHVHTFNSQGRRRHRGRTGTFLLVRQFSVVRK